MEVLVDPREVGVDSVVWRGGAVLSGLETAQAHQIRFAFSKCRLWFLQSFRISSFVVRIQFLCWNSDFYKKSKLFLDIYNLSENCSFFKKMPVCFWGTVTLVFIVYCSLLQGGVQCTMSESGYNLQWLINIKSRPISRKPMHIKIWKDATPLSSLKSLDRFFVRKAS